MTGLRVAFLGACAFLLSSMAEPNGYLEAARQLDETISATYAYLDELPGGQLPDSPELRARREAVLDADTLLRYAEERIASLADHHAITSRSFRDSWAIVPSYADLWLVSKDGGVVVDAVRAGSPAARAGVAAGDRIVSVDGVPAEQAIARFWSGMGLPVTPARADYAARVLLAGRRDRDRHFEIAGSSGEARQMTLPSLYAMPSSPEEPLRVCPLGGGSLIRFNNSLGDDATIAEFDRALQAIPEDRELVLDLRDTPSGGNTSVARAIMGWFVEEARGYQVHNRPEELRETGIARQWIEQVLPREGKHRAKLPKILVGRWTGSMGEGLAIGFAALGAEVVGTPMAGLRGSVEDLPVGEGGLSVKLPTERLMTVDGLPREQFIPAPADPALPPDAGC